MLLHLLFLHFFLYELLPFRGERIPLRIQNDDGYELCDWEVLARGHAVLDGCMVPSELDVRWILPDNELTYYTFELSEFEYDRPGPS